MTQALSYRDDGPLVELSSRVLPSRQVPAPLALTAVALLPLLAALVVPASQAPMALALSAVVAGMAAGPATRSPHDGRLDWLVPPLLRFAEYAALLRLAVLQGADAVPACYALLAVLAYHHYDTVYRLRDRGEQLPIWLQRLGLGWEGRLLVAALAAQLGLLRPALLVAAVLLGALYVVEGVVGWVAASRRGAVRVDPDSAEPDGVTP